MKSFKQFANLTDDTTISDDAVIATTNYGGFAGMWTVGLQSEATHGGYRIYGSPSSRTWDKSRGRYHRPSGACLTEMINHAKDISR